MNINENTIKIKDLSELKVGDYFFPILSTDSGATVNLDCKVGDLHRILEKTRYSISYTNPSSMYESRPTRVFVEEWIKNGLLIKLKTEATEKEIDELLTITNF